MAATAVGWSVAAGRVQQPNEASHEGTMVTTSAARRVPACHACCMATAAQVEGVGLLLLLLFQVASPPHLGLCSKVWMPQINVCGQTRTNYVDHVDLCL